MFSIKKTNKRIYINICGLNIRIIRWFRPRIRGLNPTIHFVHVVEPRNPGDMLCYPYLYFKKYFKRFNVQIHHTKDIKFESIRAHDIVILASGGCFEVLDLFQETINRLLDMCDNVIAWGCGHNAHHDRPVYWPIDFKKFKLLSVRDYKYDNQRYVPCVSCLLSQLDKKYDIVRRIGVVEHQDFPIDIDIEKINHKVGIDAIIRFIGSSEIIVTNTYHCAYWAMLMGKKVILYKPFSTKFYFFRHQPVIYSGNLEEDIAKSKTYPDYLHESRNLNYQFFEDVRCIIAGKKIKQGQ